MVVETATSSHMCEPSEEDVTEMDKLLSDGKRNYVCNQPHLALDCFVELCEKLAKWYGQESEKCVEAYLYYGKTLLDIARLENGVLGHAIRETPVFGAKADVEEGEKFEKDCNTEDEEDALKPDDIRTHVERAMREDNLYNISTEEETEEEEEIPITEAGDGGVGSNEKEENGDECNEKEENGATSTNVDTEEVESHADATALSAAEEPTSITAEEKSGETEKMDVDDGIDCDGSGEDDDTEDVSNLELSWEMLELTSVICKRQLEEKRDDHEAVKITLAEAKHGLAQISLEMERYEDAVNDFTESLNLYKEVIEDKNGRVIAEGHYNIGLALSFDKKYSESIEWFEKAVAILKARVTDLESKVKDTEDKKETSDKNKAQLDEWKKEIIELNDLIVLDMMAKIEDNHESKKLLDDSINTIKTAASEMLSGMNGTKNEFDAGFSEGFDTPSSTSAEVVHDCTDSVRSLKRKNEETTDDGEAKQTKSEEPTVSKE